MNLFHENTCIRFVDRSNELDYIIIQKSGKGYELKITNVEEHTIFIFI